MDQKHYLGTIMTGAARRMSSIYASKLVVRASKLSFDYKANILKWL